MYLPFIEIKIFTKTTRRTSQRSVVRIPINDYSVQWVNSPSKLTQIGLNSDLEANDKYIFNVETHFKTFINQIKLTSMLIHFFHHTFNCNSLCVQQVYGIQTLYYSIRNRIHFYPNQIYTLHSMTSSKSSKFFRQQVSISFSEVFREHLNLFPTWAD